MCHLASIAGALASALLGAAAPADRVPSGDVRYRVLLAGEPAGWARLAVKCAAASCDVVWESALAAPEPARGVAVRRRIDARTDVLGHARSIRAASREDGRDRAARGDGGGLVPASLAEALLGAAADGERRCLVVRDEESGRDGEACARREGEWLEGAVLGERVRFRASPGALPSEVVLPGQRVRFVADPAAALPRRGPRLLGAEVPGPREAAAAARFCGLVPDPPAASAPAAAPRRFPPGATCRERTARYLALVEAAGLSGRTAIGVAHDGRGFVWHAWAEVWDGRRWVAVDPSFEQAPARAPRFTVARYEAADLAARAAAGRAVLACWGRARVE